MWVLLLVGSLAQAGPWTRDLGSYYVQGGADVYVPSEYVVQGEGVSSDDRFIGRNYGVYGEVGLSPKHPIQLTFSLPVVVSTVDFERTDTFRMAEGRTTTVRAQDLRIAPQVALHPDLPLAAALEVKLPLYDNASVCKDNPLFREICALPGWGQTDITPWLMAGASGKKAPLWGELGVGYVIRTETFGDWKPKIELVDALAWRATAGANLGKTLWMIKGFGQHNLAESDVSNAYVMVQPAAMFTAADRVGLELHMGWELYANNQSRGVSYGAALSVFH